MLYADDACVVSRSPRWLERLIAAFVKVFSPLGFIISASKTKTICMPIPRAPATQIVFNGTGKQNHQRTPFIYLGGAATETPTLLDEIERRIIARWMSFRCYTRELYDRAKAHLLLNARRVRSEVVKDLIYGCATWSLP